MTDGEALLDSDDVANALTEDGANDILLASSAALKRVEDGKDHNRVDRVLGLPFGEVKRSRHDGRCFHASPANVNL
jgi:hypothetical protein